MTSKPETTRTVSKFAKVIMNDREQRALGWLLSSTYNGQIVSGYELPNVMVLRAIQKRLGRPARKLT